MNIKNIFLQQIKYLDLKYFLLVSSVVIVIGIYGKYRCNHIKDHKDILEFSLFKGSKKYGLDGWSVSHYLFFSILGYLYPNTLLPTMALGSVWELFETYVGIYQPKIINGFGFCNSPTAENGKKIWWYGKWTDIIVNFLGFITGKTIKHGKFSLL